jgi:hypothetical protein
MIAGMGKAHDPGPGSRVDNPQDVEVTGDLPMSLTTFVGRERELDELRSLFLEGKRLVTLVGIGGIGKALVWNGDLPRPLQQILFETADDLTPPAPASLSRAG